MVQTCLCMWSQEIFATTEKLLYICLNLIRAQTILTTQNILRMMMYCFPPSRIMNIHMPPQPPLKNKALHNHSIMNYLMLCFIGTINSIFSCQTCHLFLPYFYREKLHYIRNQEIVHFCTYLWKVMCSYSMFLQLRLAKQQL
jgi:hypothetical protein